MPSEYGMGTLSLLQLLSPGIGLVLVGVSVSFAAPLLLYVIARWRAHRTPDPQLGFKFALHWFATSALQTGFVGCALIVYAVLRPTEGGDGSGELYRAAFGMLIPAALVYGIHIAVLKHTNDDAAPAVRRLLLGYNLLVTGIIAFAGLVLGFQALFAKGRTGGLGHAFAAVVLVYGTAWLALGWRFLQLVRFDGFSSGSGAAPEAEPQQPPPATTVGGAALPSLGGGAYPPIDPRQSGSG